MWLRMTLLLGLAVISSAGFSQETSGVLRIRFEDSQTGSYVQPDQVLINGREETKALDGRGNLSLELADGRYEISAVAEAYTSVTVSAVVDSQNTMVNTIALDPVDASPEADIPADVAIVSGTVVDDESGELLEGAKITVPETGDTTVTASAGSFEISIAVPESSDESASTRKITLAVAKAGYLAERRKNVEVIAGNDKKYILRLARTPTGQQDAERVIDEAQPEQKRHVGWAFDLGAAR